MGRAGRQPGDDGVRLPGRALGVKTPASMRRRVLRASARRSPSNSETIAGLASRAGQTTTCGTRHQALPSPTGCATPELTCQRQSGGPWPSAVRGGEGVRAAHCRGGTTRSHCRSPGSGHADHSAEADWRLRGRLAGDVGCVQRPRCRPNGATMGLRNTCARRCQATRRPGGTRAGEVPQTALCEATDLRVITHAFAFSRLFRWSAQALRQSVSRRPGEEAHGLCTGRRRVRRAGCSARERERARC